jgi:hypothetical protein
MKPADIAAAAARLEDMGIYPWYNMADHDVPEGTPEGNYRMLRILMDSEEGRAYEKLSTDTDRLDYMRKHAHDKYNVVQVDSTFYEDRENGKRYLIKFKSPEYEGLRKLLREDGSYWSPEDREWDAMIQYYKDHAPTVEDIVIRSCTSGDK